MTAINEDKLEGKLSTVTDDEYFEAVAQLPRVYSLEGVEVDVTSDIRDERGKNA